MAEEIQLLACGYSAQCTVRGCGARATMLARYTDGQGRPLKQRELYDYARTGPGANQKNVSSSNDALNKPRVHRRLRVPRFCSFDPLHRSEDVCQDRILSATVPSRHHLADES